MRPVMPPVEIPPDLTIVPKPHIWDRRKDGAWFCKACGTTAIKDRNHCPGQEFTWGSIEVENLTLVEACDIVELEYDIGGEG
jgi:hypothetical protein